MQYDITSKVLIEKGALSLFRFFQNREAREIQRIELQPQEMPSLKKGDAVLKITDLNGSEEIQIWEFKVKWNPREIPNLMDYAIRAKQLYKLPVRPILFLFLEHPNATGVYEDENFRFVFVLIKFWELDARAVFESGDFFLYPFIPVMKGPETLVFAAEEKLYSSDIDKQDKAELIAALTVFAGLRSKEISIQLFQQRRDLMMESYAYELFRQDAMESARKEVLKEGLEQGRLKGLEQGRQEGLEQGRQKGLEQGTVLKGRKDILHVLQIRFQVVPFHTREFIEHIDQEAMLDVLLEKAITAASLQEFDNVIQQIRS